MERPVEPKPPRETVDGCDTDGREGWRMTWLGTRTAPVVPVPIRAPDAVEKVLLPVRR